MTIVYQNSHNPVQAGDVVEALTGGERTVVLRYTNEENTATRRKRPEYVYLERIPEAIRAEWRKAESTIPIRSRVPIG